MTTTLDTGRPLSATGSESTPSLLDAAQDEQRVLARLIEEGDQALDRMYAMATTGTLVLTDAAPGGHRGRPEQPVPAADLRLDLGGLDYYERRQRLFEALRALRPGRLLRVTSDHIDDVCWLRYEAEARMDQRYRWSVPLDESSVEVVVDL